MALAARTTCLRCEGEGNTTVLVPTYRGNLCPVHNAAFLASLDRLARQHLGLPDPEDIRNRPGQPSPRPI